MQIPKENDTKDSAEFADCPYFALFCCKTNDNKNIIEINTKKFSAVDCEHCPQGAVPCSGNGPRPSLGKRFAHSYIIFPVGTEQFMHRISPSMIL